MTSLIERLRTLQVQQPASWSETGLHVRPNLHGLLRYPAMMVPRMQGDIMDAITATVGSGCRVIDPFVGSGTVMTEALVRGLDFTGVDINPLAILVCEAKAAIDAGANVEAAAQDVMRACRFDVATSVDVDFPNIAKWFDERTSLRLSAIRRAICAVPHQGTRKVLWVVLAETIRLCSNSRTSTYKLHKRPDDDRVDAEQVWTTFDANLRSMLDRVAAYRRVLETRRVVAPDVRLICDDVRRSDLDACLRDHAVVVTSPPYGDNQTTIPYGQFSYLAIRWIPEEDMHASAVALTANTHSLDTASLGGSLRGVAAKVERVAAVSPSYVGAFEAAARVDGGAGFRKVTTFLSDLFDAFAHVCGFARGPMHWVVTTGNRSAGGHEVPLDTICREMLCALGASPVATLRRNLPSKRMPSRNNMGQMITAETTLVVEFA